MTVCVKLSWKSIYLTPTQTDMTPTQKCQYWTQIPDWSIHINKISQWYSTFFLLSSNCAYISTLNWKLINSSHCWWFCCWLSIRKSAEAIGFGYIPYWKSVKDEAHSKRPEWTSPVELIIQRQPCPGKPASCRKWAPCAFCLGQGHSFYGWCTADTNQNHYISTCIKTSFMLVAVSVSGQCCFMLMDSESKIFGAAIFVVSWFGCSVYWFPALLALMWPVQSARC